MQDLKPFNVRGWRVEPELDRLARGADIVKIDPRNVRLLMLLASRAGQVVSQREIEEIVWNGSIVSSDSIYQSIAQLRRALGETGSDRYIQTVPRKGYRLVAPVSLAQLSDASIEPRPAATAEPVNLAPLASRRPLLVAAAASAGVAIAIAIFATLDTDEPQASQPRSNEAPLTASTQTRSSVSPDVELPPQLQGSVHYRQSIVRLEKVLESQSASAGEHDFTLVPTLFTLAQNHLLVGEPLKSQEVARRGLSILKRYERELSPPGIGFHSSLAQALRDTDRYALAEQHLRQALELSRRLNGEESTPTAALLNQIALLRIKEGRYDEAAEHARAALSAYEHAADRTTPYAAYLNSTLAFALIKKDQLEEAIATSTRALDDLKADDAKEPYFVAIAHHALGEALLLAGRTEEAGTVLQREIALLRTVPHPDADMVRATRMLEQAKKHPN